jgi:hypothetical protein
MIIYHTYIEDDDDDDGVIEMMIDTVDHNNIIFIVYC